MARTKKLFRRGRTHAVRGPESWEEFFRFRDKAMEADRKAFEEFLAERGDEAPERRAFGRVKRLRTEDWAK